MKNGSDLLTVARKGRHFVARRNAPRWLVVNEVGALVLFLREQGHSLDDITKTIHKTYDCSRAEAKQDTVSFWTGIEASGFLSQPPSQTTGLSKVKLSAPELYVTTRCNGSCTYCAVRGAFTEGDMPPELFREIVRQAADLGAWRFVVTGGEPFVREDLMKLLRSVQGVARIQVLTNGTLIDSAKARELARLGVAVQVSLDGGCEEVHDHIRGEGTFEAAMRGIRLLCDAGVSPVTINFTIQGANAEALRGLLELAEREGLKEVSLAPLVPAVDGNRKFQCADPQSILTVKRFLDKYDGPILTGLRVPGFGRDAVCGRQWCSPGTSPSIGPDGSVYPCTPFACTPFLMGRIPENTLEEVLSSPTAADLRRGWSERADGIEECSSCAWKHFCHAGCSAFAYHQHGTLLAKDCFCEVRKQLYTELFLGGQDNGDRCPN